MDNASSMNPLFLSPATPPTPAIKPRRVESPSSINTYKQCPRKYFYQYIMKYPTSPNIHTILGNVVHSVLEEFYEQDVSLYSDQTFEDGFKQSVQTLLIRNWNEARPRLTQIGIKPDEERHYFDEACLMLLNWVGKFSEKVRGQRMPFGDAFAKLMPEREKEYTCAQLSVRGIIDAVERVEGNLRLMDYKTSKRFEMSEEYKLQLSIYALMYAEHHGEPPVEVGLYFLKDPYQFEYTIPVDQELLDLARVEIEVMHINTQSGNIVDYPKHVTPLCKWSTGQCDFYDRCFNQKSLLSQNP